MWNVKVGEKEETAIEVVGEDERTKFAFSDALVKDSFVGRQHFDVRGSRAGGGKVGEEGFLWHDSSSAILYGSGRGREDHVEVLNRRSTQLVTRSKS